jgi:hypothetical protein
LPPFNIEKRDTLRFHPGDTIPAPLWNKFLSDQAATAGKTLKSPVDRMPVVVPPDYNFFMIIVKPDSTVHYHIRNIKTGKDVPLPPVTNGKFITLP